MLVPNSQITIAATCTCTTVLQQPHQSKTYYPSFRCEKMGYREVVADFFTKLIKLVAYQSLDLRADRVVQQRELMQALQEIKANKSRGFYSANEDLCCWSRPQLHLALSEIPVCPKHHKNHRN